ncbi:MAG: hypothetical protein RSB82_00480 [Victivallaceae bacterium]
MKPAIALFGEAEKGNYDAAYLCHDLIDLCSYLGQKESNGLFLAIRSLMYDYSVIYFRVKEEGFSTENYFFGLHFLKTQSSLRNIIALGLPGVGDREIIDASCSICHKYGSLLICSETDFYDLLTSK